VSAAETNGPHRRLKTPRLLSGKPDEHDPGKGHPQASAAHETFSARYAHTPPRPSPYLSTAQATHSPELISNLVPLQGIGGSRPQSAQVAGEDSIELATSLVDSLH